MAKWTKFVAVVLLVVMLAVSVALGNTFRVVTPNEYSSYIEPTYSYNAGVMLAGVAASLLVFTSLLALGGILQRLDDIRDRLPQRRKEDD